MYAIDYCLTCDGPRMVVDTHDEQDESGEYLVMDLECGHEIVLRPTR